MKKWNEIKRRQVYRGYRKIDNVEFRQPDGSCKDFDIKMEPLVASVVALTKDLEVILATQFRPGPQKVVHELPGGMIESGEQPLQAAARELLEETGYGGHIIALMDYNVCAYSTQRRYCFLALDCNKVSDQKLDDGELVDIKLTSLDDFKNYLMSGDLTDTTCAFAALAYLRDNNIVSE